MPARSATCSRLRALRRGATGMITDGAVRDTPAVAELDIAVYHGASHAATFSRTHMPLEHQMPIACAGVTVMPGDIIVGDGEGAVVIPPSLVVELAAASVQQEAEEIVGARACRRRREHHRCVPGVEGTPPGVRSVVGRHVRARSRNDDTAIDRHQELHPRQSDPGRVANRAAAGVERDRATRSGRGDGARQRRRRSTPTCSTTSVEILAGAGADWRHIARITFYVPDLSYRDSCNPIWVEHFPDAESRPARHTQIVADTKVATCEFIAYVDD